jgi:hypothetical protein
MSKARLKRKREMRKKEKKKKGERKDAGLKVVLVVPEKCGGR